MQLTGLVSNVITYTALISACEKCHQTTEAMELSVEMRQRGLVTDGITPNAHISAYATITGLDYSVRTHTTLTRSALLHPSASTPDVITLAALTSDRDKD